VHYYHCSDVEHPNGQVLTGPATRGAESRWTGVELTYVPDRVYLFKGDGDPQTLGIPSFSPVPVNVYEVEPRGELLPDRNLGLWEAVSCESARVLACIHRPPREPDPGA
jgi:hypothetical protein